MTDALHAHSSLSHAASKVVKFPHMPHRHFKLLCYAKSTNKPDGFTLRGHGMCGGPGQSYNSQINAPQVYMTL